MVRRLFHSGGKPEKMEFAASVKAAGGALDVNGAASDVLGAMTLSDLMLRLKHPSYFDLVRVFSPDFKGASAGKKSLRSEEHTSELQSH